MQGYTLENIKELNRQSPRINPRPTDEEISNLKVGDLVKLIFKLDTPTENGFNGERMWIIIREISGNTFKGELNNEPYHLKSVKCGDIVKFTKDNIATVWNDNIKNIDLDKFAILTKRAWENKQINYATKIDELLNDKDSGWQLFYGDEDETYLNDEDNTALIPIGAVLQFEPLLEKVFLTDAKAVTYSNSINAFIEIPDYFY